MGMPPATAPVAVIPRFSSVDDVAERLAATGYLASDAIATTVFLADRLGKPLLIEGPAGVGHARAPPAVCRQTGHTEQLLERDRQTVPGAAGARGIASLPIELARLSSRRLPIDMGECVQFVAGLRSGVRALEQGLRAHALVQHAGNLLAQRDRGDG